MKSAIIFIGLLLCGAAAGAGAAFFWPAPATEEHQAEAPTDSHDAAPPGAPVYIDLHNQFVVPVVENGAVTAMVVLTLSLATTAADEDRVRAQEPRLRDQFLQVLFNHANTGKFSGLFTAPTTLGDLRHSLLTAAKDTVGDGVGDVLIVDIVRQDS